MRLPLPAWLPLILALTLSTPVGTGQGQPQGRTADPDRFEADIRRFEEGDRRSPPPEGAVVFIGSSSIRRWDTLERDFPGVPVLNRGFGGSEAEHVVRYANRIIVPYKPARIVFYAGDNDLARGKTPGRIAADVESLADIVRKELPGTRLAILSVKPSLARWHLVASTRETNARLRALADSRPELTFIDVFTPMIGDDGKPVPEHFVEDGLHLSEAGYRIWVDGLAPFVRSDERR